jgi:cobalt-zinc-cadmium efflux system outer membrane protein
VQITPLGMVRESSGGTQLSRFCIHYLWAAAALTAPLQGQMQLSLAGAIQQALAGNPQLGVTDARVDASRALRQQAGLGPNPRLVLQSENDRFGGTSSPFLYSRDADSYAFLAQTVETGGKRVRRVEVAANNVRRSELERDLVRRQIASRVATTYWSAVGSRRARDVLTQEIQTFERVVQYHRDRVKEGAAAEVDLTRVEVERDRLSSSLQNASQESERAMIALFREMGALEYPAVVLTESLEALPQVKQTTAEEALSHRIEMHLASHSIEQARANLDLQRANSKPDPDIHLGYKRTAGFDTLYAAIQIPLPIRNRNQGQIAAAAADIKGAESLVAVTAQSVRAELASAEKDFENRNKLIRETLRPMRERASEVSRILQAAYREGGTDLLRLLDAERARIDAELLYVRTLSELQQSAVSLRAAQGDLP